MLRRAWRHLPTLLLPLLALGLAFGPQAMMLAGTRQTPGMEHGHSHHGVPGSHPSPDCCQWCEACCAARTVAPEPPVVRVVAVVTGFPETPVEATPPRPPAAPHRLPFAQGPPPILM
jgi:hypothetical protein